MKRFASPASMVLVILICLALAGYGLFRLLESSLQKQAQSYVDEAVPQIVALWDSEELHRRLHADALMKTPSDLINRQFFSFMTLGAMKQYTGSKGMVVMSKSSTDDRLIFAGHYLAEADFENGHATITVRVIKEEDQWKILEFFVEPRLLGDSQSTRTESAEQQAAEISLSRAQLEEIAGKLHEDDILGLRRHVKEVLKLAQICEEEGNDQRAIQLYAGALQADAGNLPRQLRYARLLIKHDRRKEGLVRLHYVYEFAEEDHLIREAADLLRDLGEEPPQPKLRQDVRKDVEIVLVPTGNTGEPILSELSAALRDRMGITVSISDLKVDAGKEDRKSAQPYTAEVLSGIQKKLSRLQRELLERELGVSDEHLKSLQHQIRFIRAYFNRSGKEGRATSRNFEAEIKKLGESGQYDLVRLTEELKRIFPADGSKTLKGYLGVTPLDLYVGDAPFCYGGTRGAYGEISYYHFSPMRNGESQSRPLIVTRALKQAISSIGRMLGMPRCNNPYCAGGFARSLTELDAKSDQLCVECRERLRDYGQSSPGRNRSLEYSQIGGPCPTHTGPFRQTTDALFLPPTSGIDPPIR